MKFSFNCQCASEHMLSLSLAWRDLGSVSG